MRTGNVNTAFCGSRIDRSGFTLVEILAVIGIIGLLAAATLVALSGSRGFFRAATAKMRLDDVEQALELYKQKYGEYPPDCCATDAEIQHHIIKRWPKSLKNRDPGMRAMVDFARDKMTKTPGSALLFWLAGPPEEVPVVGSGETTIAYDGFFADPIDPFGLGTGFDKDNETRVEPLIELTYDSEGKSGNYNENGFVFNGQVMAYFRAQPKKGYALKDFHWNGTFAAPYMKGGRWYNPDTFQLILPGEDGSFGSDPCGPDEADHEHGDHGDFEPHDLNDPDSVTPEDFDNITNFTNGATLESEKD